MNQEAGLCVTASMRQLSEQIFSSEIGTSDYLCPVHQDSSAKTEQINAKSEAYSDGIDLNQAQYCKVELKMERKLLCVQMEEDIGFTFIFTFIGLLMIYFIYVSSYT